MWRTLTRVAAFRSEFHQTVADGSFFVGRHPRTMPRSARSVQRLSRTAASVGRPNSPFTA